MNKKCFSLIKLFSYLILISLLINIFNYYLNLISKNENKSEMKYSKLNLIKEKKTILFIYKEQVNRLSNTIFLPKYENFRLTFILNIQILENQFYYLLKNFQNSNQYFHILCFETSQNKQIFSFNLNFTIKKKKLIFQESKSSLIKIREKELNKINFEINLKFSLNFNLIFKYQWINLTEIKRFEWPKWPLEKSCIHFIEKNFKKNKFLLNSRCLFTNLLIHSTLKQSFINERNSFIYWLDKQYKYSFFQLKKEKNLLNRRLSPIELSLNENYCSLNFQKWISEYEEWHEKISLKLSYSSKTFEEQKNEIIKLNIRFIIYEKPSTGTADRIVHLMTTYLIAILTKRFLLFDSTWPEFFNIIQSKLNYNINSILPFFNLINNSSKDFQIKIHETNLNNINEYYNYNKDYPERILRFQGHMGRIIQIMISNQSIYKDFLINYLNIKPEYMFACLFHTLFIPRLEILIERTSILLKQSFGYSFEEILQILLSPQIYSIGIQIRTFDSLTNNKFNKNLKDKAFINLYENYLNCAKNILNQNKINLYPIIYLLSNANYLRQLFLKRYQLSKHLLNNIHLLNKTQLNLISNPDPIQHISQTLQNRLAFQQSIFDIFLFSFSQQFIITTESGFGRLAVFLSFNKKNLFSMSFDEFLSCKYENQTISLIDSAYHWSGI